MISSRGKSVGRIFRLAVCCAARRFGSRRAGVGRSTSSRRPLVLRWRRRIRPTSRVTAVRSAGQSALSYHHHFHKHFISQIANQILLRPGSATHAGPMRGVLLVKTNHQRTRVICNMRSHPIGDTTTYSRATPSIGPTFAPRRSAPETGKPRYRDEQSTQPVSERRTAARRGELPPRALGHRVNRRQEVSTLISTTRSNIRRHDLHYFSRRAMQQTDPIVVNQSRGEPTQFPFERQQKLVWRTPHGATRTQDHRQPELPSVSEVTPARSHEPEDIQQAAPAIAQSVATQMAKLDPAVLDRLAENVIDRVEKRIRIARERRGL